VSAGASVRLLTPPGVGGIAVVGLSGPEGERILRECFRSAGRGGGPVWEPGRVHYGHVLDGDEVLDEVLVACVPPDGGVVLEINCHGGMVPARRLMELLVERGAEEGPPSGLTLGRKLAKLERELLEQLIHARTERAADVVLVQLSGVLRDELERLKGMPAGEHLKRGIERLRATVRYGRRLVEPATVVVTGAANVGKSTLANALVGRERSIVHHVPGTTRDAVTSVASVEGLPVIVVDTAGLRQATDEIEKIGVRRALERAGACDLVVWVFDHSREVTDDEQSYLRVLKDMPLIPVINKIDLEEHLAAADVRDMLSLDVLMTCALTGRGIEELRRSVFASLVGAEVPARDAPVVTTAALAEALDAVAAKIDAGGTGTLLDALLRA